MNVASRFLFIVAALGIFSVATPAANDPYQPVPYVQLKHPEWTRNATIYQINTRQFTAEGTLRAAEAQLPRIKALNVDIVWLMPIHPIGEKNRKGGLGSPYAVRDYLAVNPELGTLDDLRHFVATAHALGLHVILDWVANHTAWDNALALQHPDWYKHDWKGAFRPTLWWDWSDIIDLDYNQPGLRKYMTDALKYWVKVADVDGYRCDVAGFVPVDFWDNARRELDAIKPVFLLGEWESRDLHAHAFDATYAWSWYSAVHDIAAGKADLGALFTYYAWNEGFYPPDCMRMTFTSNHDKNSWDGTGPEQFGPALETAIVLSVVGDGLPLLYNSQEAGETKRLKFFEKDPIEWRESPMADLFKKLFALKHANTALWNAHWGAKMVPVTNDARNQVLSFVRQNERDKVFAVMNFSATPRTVKLEDDGLYTGAYTDFATGEKITLAPAATLTLPAWGWRVFVK